MSGWIGPLGQLVKVSGPAGLSVVPDRPSSSEVTLGGRRFHRSAPRQHRAWAFQSTSVESATDLAPLAMFASGAWGDGPFWWLSPWAAGTNVLTPEGSLLVNAGLNGGAVTGPVQATDGTWFPVSVAAGSGGVGGVARSKARNWVASPRSVTYTASLYCSPGQSVRVLEYASATGSPIQTRTSPAATGPGLTRVSVTATARDTTNLLRLDVVGAGTCAGAALSFTSRLTPWGVGDGCEEAVVIDSGMDVTSIAYGPWAGQSFEIREVG